MSLEVVWELAPRSNRIARHRVAAGARVEEQLPARRLTSERGCRGNNKEGKRQGHKRQNQSSDQSGRCGSVSRVSCGIPRTYQLLGNGCINGAYTTLGTVTEPETLLRLSYATGLISFARHCRSVRVVCARREIRFGWIVENRVELAGHRPKDPQSARPPALRNGCCSGRVAGGMTLDAELALMAPHAKRGAGLPHHPEMLRDPGAPRLVIAQVMAHGAQIGLPFVALLAYGRGASCDGSVAGLPARPTKRMRHLKLVAVVAETVLVTHGALRPIGLRDLPVA